MREGAYRRIGHMPTVPGARTSLFAPEMDRIFLAVRATPNEPAAVWVFTPNPSYAPNKRATFSAGEPGDPKTSARVVRITMQDADDVLRFVPDRVEVRKGEQIRFVIWNDGIYHHEFMLATPDENRKISDLTKKYPGMGRIGSNGIKVYSFGKGELLWRFTQKGEFEFASPVDDDYDDGMRGTIVVK
jgi:uncharacterized cupredoxin-like copper-binding protein